MRVSSPETDSGKLRHLSPLIGSRNLAEVMRQALTPIQTIVSTSCSSLNVRYGGIDASINPGMSLPDSVGAGLENLLFFPQKTTSSQLAQQFGEITVEMIQLVFLLILSSAIYNLTS